MLKGRFVLFAMAGVCLILANGWSILRRRTMVLLPLLLCVSMGYLAIQPWLRDELPSQHVIHFIDQGKWQVLGRVANQPIIKQGRCRFLLEANQLDRNGEIHEVSGLIRITAMGAVPVLGQGDQILLSGHLHGIDSFGNPGGFDYARFMAFRGVRTRLYARGESIACLESGADGWRARVDRARQTLKMTKALTGESADTIAVFNTLVLGERDGIDEDLRNAFSRAGVSHVLAISGMHIGMVAVLAFAVGFRLLVWIPPLLLRGWYWPMG